MSDVVERLKFGQCRVRTADRVRMNPVRLLARAFLLLKQNRHLKIHEKTGSILQGFLSRLHISLVYLRQYEKIKTIHTGWKSGLIYFSLFLKEVPKYWGLKWIDSGKKEFEQFFLILPRRVLFLYPFTPTPIPLRASVIRTNN